MERLTHKSIIGGWTYGVPRQKVVDLLAAYEDTMPIERAQELAQDEKDGRNDTVYTIQEDYFACDKCRHGDGAYYQAQINKVSCDMNNGLHCPLYVKEHKVGGFEVKFDKSGAIVLSPPGEFGYEGLETFSGVDGKVYYTREEADAALKKREEEVNEAD